jgi:hypothetical protein
VVRCVLESLALKYREVLDKLRGQPGSRWTYSTSSAAAPERLAESNDGQRHRLCRLSPGPSKPVLGNALCSSSPGRNWRYSQARAMVAGMAELKRYEPQETAVWQAMYNRYQEIIAKRLLEIEIGFEPISNELQLNSHPRDQLVAIMNRIYHNGMTTLSGGNLSIKDDNGDIWITPSGIDKGQLDAQRHHVRPKRWRHHRPAPAIH